MSLRDKVVIVTGAAGGIGAEYAGAFADAGARVLVADVKNGLRTVAGLRDKGAEAEWHYTDVSSRANTDEMVSAALQRWGRVDVLVNNAARYAGLHRGPMESIPTEEWDAVQAVNVRGVWNATASALTPMKQQSTGSIVNIASTTAFKGTPNNLHYVASKGAVVAMTRAMAREIGGMGIRVNCVAPGLVDNEASRLGQEATFDDRAVDRARERCLHRDMHSTDVVGAVLFLASDASAFITGQCLNVDGGAVLK